MTGCNARPRTDRAHGRDARQHAGLANSWWHYVISLDRALERERIEFKDGCLIAADIAFRASGKNPLSLHQTFDVLQHGQTLMTRGLLSNQEESLGSRSISSSTV